MEGGFCQIQLQINKSMIQPTTKLSHLDQNDEMLMSVMCALFIMKMMFLKVVKQIGYFVKVEGC